MIRELHQSFLALEQALSELQTELLRHKPKLWLPLTPSEQAYSDELSVLTSLLTDLWYEDVHQDGRETRSRHGLVLASPSIIAIIQKINDLKDCFKTQVKKTREELAPNLWLEEYARLGADPLREAMQESNLKRVHLKQCYRHIPLLEYRPEKIGFSWYAHGRSIKKISLQEAQQALLALGDHKTHIQVQLDNLNKLSAGTVLAQIQTLAPVVRANLVFDNSAPYPSKALNASLPIFIPDTGRGLPEFNRIDLEPPQGRTRKERADQKIDPAPFLPSIRVHLYK
jgi:hypothetical protein